MFDKIKSLVTDCIALATTLRAENNALKEQLAAAEKGKADAEAAAQQLKDLLSQFHASGN